MNDNTLVKWYIPQRVTLSYLQDEVSIEDVHHLSDKAISLLQQGQTPVHAIIDARHMKKHPINISLITKNARFLREPNLGWFILITTSSMIKFIGVTISQISRTDFKVVLTPEEAIEFLSNSDNTLPEFPPYETMLKNNWAKE